MAVFVPRLKAPLESDRYWLHYSVGGFNTAIKMDSHGSVLPNCVGYAQGRYREICMDNKVGSAIGKNFSGDAETFFAAAKKAGIKTGQIPKLGAIVVWEGIGSASGHVAVVEQIKANGDIVTSNSAYKGERFYLQELKKADGYLYVKDGSRPLLGFIYQALEYTEANAQPATEIIETGKAVILRNTPVFVSETVKNAYMVKSGTYYLWDNVVKSGRIRITNEPSRVGVAGQVTCWINAADVGLKATTTTIKAGTAYTLNNTPVYASEGGSSIGKRSGIYRTWDDVIKNGRIRMTNSASRVGVAGQVSFWVDVSNLK